MTRRHYIWLCTVTGLALYSGGVTATGDDAGPSLADQRLDVMRERALSFTFRSADPDFPRQIERDPLFRYDDPTRGYIDGTVWRLGASGRPLAIITAELHPMYGGDQRIVYDFLSFSLEPFTTSSGDVRWTPSGSMLTMTRIKQGPVPAESETVRLFQLKKLAQRFSGTQKVEGELVQLRLLPKPIDHYKPTGDSDLADAAMFLLVNGRNPGLILLLETDGVDWQYGIARLSHPSVLTLSFDGKLVWEVPEANLGSSKPYNATNRDVSIPGYDSEE